jgi:hypothetical protein
VVKHVVLFKFKADATAAQKKAMIDALAALPKKIVEIKSFKLATTLPGRPARMYSVGLFAEFEDVAAIDRYIAHPDHQAVIPVIDAACETRAAFNYE